MDVRVICALPPWNRPETDYVRVHTCPVADDDTTVLATIERVFDQTGQDADHSAHDAERSARARHELR